MSAHSTNGPQCCFRAGVNGTMGFIASGGYDETVRVWDAETGACVRTLQGLTSEVNSVGYSPDGKYIASGSEDKSVRIWDGETGECERILQGHTSEVMSVGYSPDGAGVPRRQEPKDVALEAMKQERDEARAALDEARAECDEAKGQARVQLETARNEAHDLKQERDEARAALDEAKEQARVQQEIAHNEVHEMKQERDEARAERDEARAALDEARAERDEARATLRTYEAGEETLRIKNRFKLMDRNHDGKITLPELVQFLSKRGMSEEQIEDLFCDTADASDDEASWITLESFTRNYRRFDIAAPPPPDPAMAIEAALDRLGAGPMTASQARKVLGLTTAANQAIALSTHDGVQTTVAMM